MDSNQTQKLRYNSINGDEGLRRKWLTPDCESRGADLEKSAQKISANRTNVSALPLAA